MDQYLTRYSSIESIVGDIINLRLPDDPDIHRTVRNRDLAAIEQDGSVVSLAQIIQLDHSLVSLQIFAGAKGISNQASIRFLKEPMRAVYSDNVLGRIFNGSGNAIDSGPDLSLDPKVEINGPTVNPINRVLASKMIRTDVPMIDVFNCLVESQKIPIFSVSGEPYNKFLARIGIQADADVVIFAGLGLIFDDYYFFKQSFEEAGVMNRTVMYVNQASDPVVERLMVPDLALSVAERFAVDESKRVLVLITDMTAYADAMKEIGISMESIPSNRGYMGDLYSQLARRYEKACDFKGAGSITILSVTTMPGGDVTHPVPDNTGYITEGQFYLHSGVIDPFGSLSRLKQFVIEKETREDHGQIMNTMIRYYSEGVDAEQKQAMAFDLSEFDQKLLRFSGEFRRQFMDLDVALPLEKALDACWHLLAECFDKDEVVIKQNLKDKYWPK
ncbi:V-type sodium ATPase subunit B [BD1-7 clade bacterium]|uniref:V-type sodium ATPase subunit B n=1 Tax=BD1-7 clade bacterium TaxID=2029982 RepID=A0A5S9QF01_9GAMM|nr:V-type sodium ATPase subunit B [BD1-7 clade bacterium]CAA0117115.1 V-type sodium ATPase subunit B [BD1-7 clade bacterium]